MLNLNYERGLERLQEIVRSRKPEYLSEFALFQSRLLACLERERLYGQSSNNDAERNEAIHRLMQFADEHFSIQFIELCRTDAPSHEEMGDVPAASTPLTTYDRGEEIWSVGSEISVKNVRYIIQEPVEIKWAADKSAAHQQARALQVGANRMTWLRQVQLYRATERAQAWKEALEKEERLMNLLEPKLPQKLPRLLDFEPGKRALTLVYNTTQESSWSRNFQRSGQLLSQRLTRTLLLSAISLCETLKALHAQQIAHRFLTPDKIFLLDGRKALLQDIGLATWRYEPGEGPDLYRSPEQAASNTRLVLPRPSTDVYQLGRILYHFICGRMPASPQQVLPLRTWNNELSTELDAVLLRSVAFNENERWRNAADFSSALKRVL